MYAVKKVVAFVALLTLVLGVADAQVYDPGTGQQIVKCPTCSGGGGGVVSGSVAINDGTNTAQKATVGPTGGLSTQNVTPAVAPVVSTAVESSHVFKSSAGSLIDAYVTVGASAGFLMIFNAVSAPADGAVTPQDCVPVSAAGTQSIFTSGAAPEGFTTGITAVFSTTGCFTKTASATAFFHGRVQ